MDFDIWTQKDIKKMFDLLDEMRAHAPGSTLFEQLEFCDHLEVVLNVIDASQNIREILLEAWLLIDYIVTYLLRDGLNLPECIENELKLLPFSFEKKIELIKKLRKIEKGKLANQKDYTPYELHPEFQKELKKDNELYQKFFALASRFEQKKSPKGAMVLMRNDFKRSRFVPEWWFQRVDVLDNQWFKSCKQLNKARNIAAHNMKMSNQEAFREFNVSSMSEFKSILLNTIDYIVFKDET